MLIEGCISQVHCLTGDALKATCHEIYFFVIVYKINNIVWCDKIWLAWLGDILGLSKWAVTFSVYSGYKKRLEKCVAHNVSTCTYHPHKCMTSHSNLNQDVLESLMHRCLSKQQMEMLGIQPKYAVLGCKKENQSWHGLPMEDNIKKVAEFYFLGSPWRFQPQFSVVLGAFHCMLS